MNLTSIHMTDLIEVLHGLLAPQPVVLRGTSRRVVTFEGRVFALMDAPISVEGPFATTAELVTSLGVKREDEPWLWDGARFVIEGEQAVGV
jgi:hypothetical protein